MARKTKPALKYTRESITQLLRDNDHAVVRALIVLFKRQTSEEQRSNTTRVWNERGFTGADAHYGCLNAKTAIKYGRLWDNQLAYWRKPNRRGVPRIAKYWRQLIEEAMLADERKAAAERMEAEEREMREVGAAMYQRQLDFA